MAGARESDDELARRKAINDAQRSTKGGDRASLERMDALLAEEQRLKNLGNAASVRRDIEETLGTDVVNQERLVGLAEAIWVKMPPSERTHFTAEDWQKQIFFRCREALKVAEEKLAENKTDEKLFVAKVKILRQTFAQQVVRAMQEVADKYKPPPAKK